MKKINNYIDGKINIGKSKNYLPVYNPATGDIQAEVVLSNKEDFNEVIQSSKKSFNEWSKVTPLNRSRILQNYKQLLEKNKDELAEIVCKEHGKTFEDAKGSVTRGI